LATPASSVVVGIGYGVQVQSVYLEAGQPTVQGQRKKIAAVTVRLEASSGGTIGCNQPDGYTLNPYQIAPAWSNMVAIPNASTPPYGSNIYPLYTGDIRIPISGGFARPGQIAVQQLQPLPMNILALIPEIDNGDLPQPAGPAAAQKQQGRGR